MGSAALHGILSTPQAPPGSPTMQVLHATWLMGDTLLVWGKRVVASGEAWVTELTLESG